MNNFSIYVNVYLSNHMISKRNILIRRLARFYEQTESHTLMQPTFKFIIHTNTKLTKYDEG